MSRCFLGHSWLLWSKPYTYTFRRMNKGNGKLAVIETYIHQRRQCGRCNKIEVRQVEP